jgi:hypothetical protein
MQEAREVLGEELRVDAVADQRCVEVARGLVFQRELLPVRDALDRRVQLREQMERRRRLGAVGAPRAGTRTVCSEPRMREVRVLARSRSAIPGSP